ncbi:shTK domain protein, partial [Ostertagia ostertagi]
TDCEDKRGDCSERAAKGYCTSAGGDEFQKQCPRSCGLCDCRDLASADDCEQVRRAGYCDSHREHSDYYCRKTCDFCPIV